MISFQNAMWRQYSQKQKYSLQKFYHYLDYCLSHFLASIKRFIMKPIWLAVTFTVKFPFGQLIADISMLCSTNLIKFLCLLLECFWIFHYEQLKNFFALITWRYLIFINSVTHMSCKLSDQFANNTSLEKMCCPCPTQTVISKVPI